jgi:dolichol-phosphate mannosyltransferase
MPRPLISIIIPAFNESANLRPMHESIRKTVQGLKYHFEFIFVDDGSTDRSEEVMQRLRVRDKRVRIVALVRNFGKEIAVTAGLHEAKGEAAIIIDADMQHPVEMIPTFLERWQKGAEVVVGVRRSNGGAPRARRAGSAIFYWMMRRISDTTFVPNSTDYRLLDRAVIDEFNRLTERNRMTRGLIDWLGFRHDYVYFKAKPRTGGGPSYSFLKLAGLAINSVVSLSLLPLKLVGYLGIAIIFTAGPLGLFLYFEKYLFDDPLHLSPSGPALLGVMILFLIGVVLVALGLIALYIASIHGEVVNRPLYVVRRPRTPQNGKRERNL